MEKKENITKEETLQKIADKAINLAIAPIIALILMTFSGRCYQNVELIIYAILSGIVITCFAFFMWAINQLDDEEE